MYSLHRPGPSKDKRGAFIFYRFMTSNILTKINSTNHLILSTRRKDSIFSFLPALNLQTSIWNVGRSCFVLWFTMYEIVLSIVSS